MRLIRCQAKNFKVISLLKFLITFSTLVVVHLLTETFPKPKSIISKGNETKTILYWTDVIDAGSFVFGTGRAPFSEMSCRVSDCVFWDMRDGEPAGLSFEDFDAVLFHGVYTSSVLGFQVTHGPRLRRPHQRYIFFAQEPPAKLGTDLSHLGDFYNWTFTYRRDSDIWHPYGSFIDLLDPEHDLLRLDRKIPVWIDPIIENASRSIPVNHKTKMAAWMVSNCKTDSQREWYVAELARHIDIDVHGACGTFFCAEDEECDEMIARNYKFFISFENSLCVDYVTEKFFRTLRYDIVPIVYGSAAYKEIAPPMSYIDVKDFKSPAHLAEYLIHLDRNPEEYQRFFWWKTYYISQRIYRESICQLCEMLHDESLPRKVYTDIDSWWNKCQNPKQFLHVERGRQIGDGRRYMLSMRY